MIVETEGNVTFSFNTNTIFGNKFLSIRAFLTFIYFYMTLFRTLSSILHSVTLSI